MAPPSAVTRETFAWWHSGGADGPDGTRSERVLPFKLNYDRTDAEPGIITCCCCGVVSGAAGGSRAPQMSLPSIKLFNNSRYGNFVRCGELKMAQYKILSDGILVAAARTPSDVAQMGHQIELESATLWT